MGNFFPLLSPLHYSPHDCNLIVFLSLKELCKFFLEQSFSALHVERRTEQEARGDGGLLPFSSPDQTIIS